LVSLSCLVAGLLCRLLLHMSSTLPSLPSTLSHFSRFSHVRQIASTNLVLHLIPLFFDLILFHCSNLSHSISQTCRYQTYHSNSRLIYHTGFVHVHTRGNCSLASYTRGAEQLLRVNIRGPWGQAWVLMCLHLLTHESCARVIYLTCDLYCIANNGWTEQWQSTGRQILNIMHHQDECCHDGVVRSFLHLPNQLTNSPEVTLSLWVPYQSIGRWIGNMHRHQSKVGYNGNDVTCNFILNSQTCIETTVGPSFLWVTIGWLQLCSITVEGVKLILVFVRICLWESFNG